MATALLYHPVSPISSNFYLLFNYRVIDESTHQGVLLQAGDSLIVEASVDCQQTYLPITVITTANHLQSNSNVRKISSLNLFIGQSPIFRIRAVRTTGNYIVDIDSVEIRIADLNNMAVISRISPINKSCGIATDTIKALFKNVGDAPVQNIPVSVQFFRPYAPPFVTFYDTINSTLLPGEQILFTFDSLINTVVSGKYTMVIKSNLSKDTLFSLGHTVNNTFVDSVFTYNSLAVPYNEMFASNSYLTDYISSFNYDPSGFLFQDVTTGFTESSVNLIHKVGPLSASHSLFFHYKFTDLSNNALPMSSGDSVVVSISTNCGASFTPIYTISNSNHSASSQWLTKQLSLSAFSGQSVLVTFMLKGVTNNSRFSIDNVVIDGVPTINLSPDTLYKCYGQPVVLNPVGSTSYQYEWTERNNPSMVLSTNQSYSPSVSGYYKVKATNGVGFSAVDSIYLFFRPLPIVSLVLPSATSRLCPNANAVALSGNSPVGGTYTGIGVSASQFSPQSAGVGTHLVTYSFTDGNNCTNTSIDTIVVTPISSVSLSLIPDFCLNNNTYTLSEGAPINGLYSGAGVSSGTFNPSVANVGTHVVTYSITDAYNCQFRDTDTIVVKSLPNASLGNDVAICAGDSVTLIATGGVSYLWNNSTTNNTLRVSPSVQTEYSVIATGSNGCTDRDSIVVSVKPVPQVQLAALDSVCLQQTPFLLTGGTATPAGGTGTYSGAGVSNNYFNPMVGLGPHTIRYTYLLNGCSSFDESVIRVFNCTGIEENGDNAVVQVYPNPVTDKVYIKVHSNVGVGKMMLCDITGKIYDSKLVDFSVQDHVLEIDMSSFASGIYFVKIESEKLVSTFKLVKR